MDTLFSIGEVLTVLSGPRSRGHTTNIPHHEPIKFVPRIHLACLFEKSTNTADRTERSSKTSRGYGTARCNWRLAQGYAYVDLWTRYMTIPSSSIIQDTDDLIVIDNMSYLMMMFHTEVLMQHLFFLFVRRCKSIDGRSYLDALFLAALLKSVDILHLLIRHLSSRYPFGGMKSYVQML